MSTPPPPFQESNPNPGKPSTQFSIINPRHQVVGSFSSSSSSKTTGETETVSISEVYVETRRDYRSNLSVASSRSTTSGVSSSHRMTRSPPSGAHDMNRTATPTWTEGTPSFTESSSSGDLGEDESNLEFFALFLYMFIISTTTRLLCHYCVLITDILCTLL